MLDTTPAAYRQRLTRTRARIESFAPTTCGLARAAIRAALRAEGFWGDERVSH